MSDITKPISSRDAPQVLKSVYNGIDASLTTSGFLTSKVGNKVTVTITTTSISNDTEVYNFYQNTNVLLYTLTIVYTGTSRTQMLSAERTA